MHKIELEIPEPMETELQQVVVKGGYASEEDVARVALAVFLKQMNHDPLPELTDEELRELETKFMLEDIEWAMRPEERDR